MDAKNGSQIVTEKLDKNNFPVWKFKTTNFLMGKRYEDYIEGDLDLTRRTYFNARDVVETYIIKWGRNLTFSPIAIHAKSFEIVELLLSTLITLKE